MNHYFKYYFTFILTLLGGAFSVQAQYYVRGVVQDAQTLEPVSGAIVSILQTSINTRTDDKGEFQVGADNNFDSIEVRFSGYIRQSAYAGDKSRKITVMMVADSGRYVAEVTGRRLPLSSASLGMADLYRFSGLRLQDALNTVPGVNMQSRTPWGGQRIILRGYYPSADNGRTNGANFNGIGYQVFLNNIPITDATGMTVMDDIDFFNLGRVDIIKGPSPLNGSYIAGSVSLFTPKPAANETSIQEQVIAGSYGLFRNNTTVQSSDGKSDVWVNYGHQNYNGFRPHDASHKDYASFASNFYTSTRNTVSAYFSYSHSYEDLAGEIDSADLYARNAVSNAVYVANNSHVEIESYRAGLTDKYQFDNHFANQTTVFATGYKLNQYFAHGFNLNNVGNFGARTVFTYQAHSSDNRFGVNGVLGASFEKSNLNEQGNFVAPYIALPPFTSAKPGTQSDVQDYAINAGIFTQWTVNLPHHFHVTAGGSMNFISFSTQNLMAKTGLYLDNPTLKDNYKPVFTPSASVTKDLGEYVSVFASASTGYAPPTLSQMTTNAGVTLVDLKPESAVQFELGSRGNLLKNRNLTYQVTVFDLGITNRLVQQTANSVSYFTNAGKQNNMGAEVYLGYSLINNTKYIISLVRPWVSYTYSDFVYKDFQAHTKSHNGGDSVIANYSNNHVAAVAPHMANIGLDLASRYGFYLNTTFRYMDKAPITFDNQHYVKSYTLLSGRLGYRRDFGRHWGLDAYAGADNLLGSTYYSFIFVGQNIQELAQGTDPYVKGGGGDGYILPAPYKATFYGGLSLKYKF